MFSTDNTFYLVLPTNETIVFGSDQSDPNWVGLVGPNGVTSAVELRESRSNISRTDGEIIGASYWGSRSVVADIFINDTNPETRSNKLTKLQRVNYLLRTSGLLQWTEKDGNQTEKQIPVRLQSFPTISHDSGPSKTVQLAFTATQPHIESQEEIVELFTPPEAENSFNFTITNEGDWITYPIIKFRTSADSPTTSSTNFYIDNITNGKRFRLNNISIEQDMEIVIDFNPTKKTVTKQIGEGEPGNIYNYLDLNSSFFGLESGENELELFTSVEFEGEELEWEVIYRHAWV